MPLAGLFRKPLSLLRRQSASDHAETMTTVPTPSPTGSRDTLDRASTEPVRGSRRSVVVRFGLTDPGPNACPMAPCVAGQSPVEPRCSANDARAGPGSCPLAMCWPDVETFEVEARRSEEGRDALGEKGEPTASSASAKIPFLSKVVVAAAAATSGGTRTNDTASRSTRLLGTCSSERGRAGGWYSTSMGQHHIPRFLLKNWSVAGPKPGHMIHRYDIEEDRWKHYLPIVRQAQTKNMYGQLETTLSRTESQAAPCIRRVVANCQLPGNVPDRSNVTERAKVGLFFAVSFCRNLSEVDFSNDVYSAMLKQQAHEKYHEELACMGIDPKDYDINITPRGALAIRNIGIVAECLNGMGLYLLYSEDGGFFIGDSPCAIYNKWYAKSPERQHLAPGATGACLLVPLSPHHVILLYDSWMYDPAKSSAVVKEWIIRVTQSDVAEINLLQLVYARQYIYSNEPELRRSVRRLRPKVVGFRSEIEKTGSGLELFEVNTGNRIERFLAFGRSAPHLNLALPYLVVTPGYRHLAHSTRHVDLPRIAYKGPGIGKEPPA